MKRRHSKGGDDYSPETLALGYGYDPFLSEGAVKPPVFLTSTFQFRTAEEGKAFFQLAYGLRNADPGEVPGLIYSRLNNPNLEIFEQRMAAWDGTEKAAAFASGMAATSTTMLGLLSPGDHIISSAPVYGGTHYLFEHILPKFGITTTQVQAGNDTAKLMREAAQRKKPKLFYVETPANPSNALVDLQAISDLKAEIATEEAPVYHVVDNTFLGPIFQRPALQGADLVIYSATKFIGGHSDLVAGVITGSKALVEQIGVLRSIMGTMATPFSGWLLLRSLETVSVRMRRQAKSAAQLAKLLLKHPAVNHVFYPGLLEEGDPQKEIYDRQCRGPGSLISFEVKGGEEAAFKVLNAFEVARLAVSLGGTESLVEHPMSMTHSDVPQEMLEAYGVTSGLIRMSVGLEHYSDLARDLRRALELIS